jgi:hypothetical protein
MTHFLRRAGFALASLAASLAAAPAAQAATAAIDALMVIRPVSGLYVDEFNDGVAPPLGNPQSAFDPNPLPPATYSLNTGASFLAGAENNGVLRFDPAGMAVSCTAAFGCNRQTMVTLNTSTTVGSGAGLRQNQDFVVLANWSFVTPDPQARYRLRLSDTFQGALSNDIVDIDVINTAAGVQVRLLDIDLAAGTANVLNSVTLSPQLQATNLVMLFDHHAFTSTVSASFQLYNGVTPVMNGYYALGQGQLFTGEDAVRVGFGAITSAVPEPGSLVLLATGLGLLGLRQRRRQA